MSTADSIAINLSGIAGDPSEIDGPTLLQAFSSFNPTLYEHARAVMLLVEPIAPLVFAVEQPRRALVDAAWFHDIGKLIIDPAILEKPSPLDEQEWAIIRRHSGEGGDFLARSASLRGAAPAVRHHHERFDGLGYPDGLVGDAIPVGAQIVAVADAYHAMVSARPYRPRLQPAEAIEELRRCAGTQFDPAMVQCFLDVHDNLEVGVPR